MPLREDEPAFAVLGEELVIRMVTSLVRLLHQSELVDLDLAKIGEAQRNLLFELSFLAIAMFEERSGIVHAGQRYFPRVTFQIGTSVDEPDLIYAGTLHDRARTLTSQRR